MNLGLTWKLFVAHARQQKVRLALTALAMVAAVGVVLWVVSAYEVIAARFDEQTDEFVGNYTAFVVPQSLEGELSAEFVSALEHDPAVEAANAVTQFRMSFRRAGTPPASPAVPSSATPGSSPPDSAAPPRGRGLGRMGPTIVGTNAREPRYPLVDGRWLDPAAGTEAVVASGVAEALSLKPGDSIEFRTKSGEVLGLTVVGITEQVQDVESAMTRTKGGAPGGTNRGPASLAAYVPLSRIAELTGAAPRINLVEIRLKPAATLDTLSGHVAAAAPVAELIRPEDVRAKLSSGFAAEGARKQAYFVTALSILASAFIIFTTLSMGVNERARQLAILRAVGLRRSQVASLVLAEAAVLALFGWIGGLAGGWLLLKLLAAASPQMFPNGVSLGGTSVVLTGACSFLGALLASIFPIWKATRISPLEAMAPLPATTRSSRWYSLAGLLSLALIALNPLLVFVPGIPESVRFALILFVGVPATVAGFILLAPLVVLGVEKVFSPVFAGVLRLQTNLVQTQLSNNMWRSAGIAAALMLGLGLYTATQVWGWSMLGGFLPGRWTPNTIVKFAGGLSDESLAKVAATPGIRPDACFELAVEQTRLVGDPLRSGERDSAVRQDNVSLIGIDTEAALGGAQPAFQLAFVQGDRGDALAKLKEGEGRNCLVPDTFLTYAGLGVGDRIGLIPHKHPDQPVEYTIVGVVSMPGSNWITKTTGIRKQSVRTAGLVFAPREQVRRDFELPKGEFFWLNAEPGVTKADLEERLKPLASAGAGRGSRGRSRGVPGDAPSERPRAGEMGAAASPAAAPTATPAPRDASRSGGGPAEPVRPRGASGVGGGPSGGGGGGLGSEAVQVSLLHEVRDGLRSRGGSAVQAMGWLPLITVIVVSLGVVNTVAASVRARRWEFGILRAVGLTRWGLSRLVISEALLVGFVASVLSLAFGILTGLTCLGLIRYVSNPWFEGVATPLTIPWLQLAYGYALTFALCFVAALWPAISSSRAEPLALLQAGRAAT